MFYTLPDGGFGSAEELPPGATEVTESAYNDYVALADADLLVLTLAEAEAAATTAEADAQDVYDEIVGIHPITALALAKLIYPPFVP